MPSVPTIRVCTNYRQISSLRLHSLSITKTPVFRKAATLLYLYPKVCCLRNIIRGKSEKFCWSRIPGRTSPEEITVFKSVGIAIQDLAAANYAYRQACQQGGEPIFNYKTTSKSIDLLNSAFRLKPNTQT